MYNGQTAATPVIGTAVAQDVCSGCVAECAKVAAEACASHFPKALQYTALGFGLHNVLINAYEKYPQLK